MCVWGGGRDGCRNGCMDGCTRTVQLTNQPSESLNIDVLNLGKEIH